MKAGVFQELIRHKLWIFKISLVVHWNICVAKKRRIPRQISFHIIADKFQFNIIDSFVKENVSEVVVEYLNSGLVGMSLLRTCLLAVALLLILLPSLLVPIILSFTLLLVAVLLAFSACVAEFPPPGGAVFLLA